MKTLLYAFALLCLATTGCKKDDIALQATDELPTGLTASRTGMFQGAGRYMVSGKVSLLQNTDKLVLRLENFSSSSGPDLKVYLSKDTRATSFINLGELKALNGNFNYEVDKNQYDSDFKYVLIWCEDFSVLFGTAELKTM
ncbi:MAG: DM13 domain-containing protein [Cytophagales bacterium]|jgi:hypothetical protein|nr:DM13 domain-containing protein [Cytophagales bacterium]